MLVQGWLDLRSSSLDNVDGLFLCSLRGLVFLLLLYDFALVLFFGRVIVLVVLLRKLSASPDRVLATVLTHS